MTSKTHTYECPKCLGKGKIRGFGHIEGGKCFLCAGSGTVDSLHASPSEVARARTNASKMFDAVCNGVAYGKDAYAAFYAKLAAKDLFIIGTKDALTILNRTSYEGEYGTVQDKGVCRRAARLIVEAGKSTVR